MLETMLAIGACYDVERVFLPVIDGVIGHLHGRLSRPLIDLRGERDGSGDEGESGDEQGEELHDD